MKSCFYCKNVKYDADCNGYCNCKDYDLYRCCVINDSHTLTRENCPYFEENKKVENSNDK